MQHFKQQQLVLLDPGPRPRLSKRGALPSCGDSRQMLDTQTCLVGWWSLQQLLEARSSRRAPNVLVVLSARCCSSRSNDGWRGLWEQLLRQLAATSLVAQLLLCLHNPSSAALGGQRHPGACVNVPSPPPPPSPLTQTPTCSLTDVSKAKNINSRLVEPICPRWHGADQQKCSSCASTLEKLTRNSDREVSIGR